MWSGNILNIPEGFLICDGTNGTPDLRDRFLIGTGTEDKGVFGGSNSKVITADNLPSGALSGVFSGYYVNGRYMVGGEGTSWGTLSGEKVSYSGYYGNGCYLYFTSFASKLTTSGWKSTPFDVRPVYLNVFYIIKVKQIKRNKRCNLNNYTSYFLLG